MGAFQIQGQKRINELYIRLNFIQYRHYLRNIVGGKFFRTDCRRQAAGIFGDKALNNIIAPVLRRLFNRFVQQTRRQQQQSVFLFKSGNVILHLFDFGNISPSYQFFKGCRSLFITAQQQLSRRQLSEITSHTGV